MEKGGAAAAGKRETNILNEKQTDRLGSTNVKLLRQIEDKSIGNDDFFKFIIFVEGGHCVYSSRASEDSNSATGYTCSIHARIKWLIF